MIEIETEKGRWLINPRYISSAGPGTTRQANDTFPDKANNIGWLCFSKETHESRIDIKNWNEVESQLLI